MKKEEIELEGSIPEPINIEDGLHTGEIVDINYRDEPYQYVDLQITIDGVTREEGEALELKIGYPQHITPNSALGGLLERFGIKIEKKKKYNLYKLLVGKKVKYVTSTEVVKNDDGSTIEYAKIVRNSVKPFSDNVEDGSE